MSHGLTNPSTWGHASEVTSAQLNDLDTKSTQVLDKRAGQTDTLQSIVTCSGAGRIRPSYVAGADADTAYQLSGGIGIINASSGLTSARVYTLSNTGAGAGDTVTILGNATYDITVRDASSNTLIVIGAAPTGLNQSRWAEFLHTGSAWILFRSSLGPISQRTTFSANGNYTVPADCYKLLVIGIGGGGGGGGGGTASSTAGNRPGGGSGGGAAMPGVAWVDTTPGSVFAVTIGSGGTGGLISGSFMTDGSDGGTTTFGSALSFRGGQGGSCGVHAATALTNFYANPGGGSVASGTARMGWLNLGATIPALGGGQPKPGVGVVMPGQGGYGGQSGLAASAGGLPHISGTLAGSGTTTGGAAGSAGSTASSTLGGGGGGGGGASMFGSGGAGGNGGNGVTSGDAGGAMPGVAAGTGAGGGGGGATGNNTGGGAIGVPGDGGSGGNGALVVIPIR